MGSYPPLSKGVGGISLVASGKHVDISTSVGGLTEDSVLLCKEIRVID